MTTAGPPSQPTHPVLEPLLERGGLDREIVEATRQEVLTFGLRRATMTSIARRAGLSRATLHRRAESTQNLILDALVIEYAKTLQAATTRVAGLSIAHERDRIGKLACEFIDLLLADGLFGSLLRRDAEVLLPYLVERLGRSQQLLIDLLAAYIKVGQQEGSVRAGSPATLALVLLQALTPFVVGHQLLRQADADLQIREHIEGLVNRYLLPLPD